MATSGSTSHADRVAVDVLGSARDGSIGGGRGGSLGNRGTSAGAVGGRAGGSAGERLQWSANTQGSASANMAAERGVVIARECTRSGADVPFEREAR